MVNYTGGGQLYGRSLYMSLTKNGVKVVVTQQLYRLNDPLQI